MSNAKDSLTITVNGTLANSRDAEAYNRLTDYCQRMGIRMSTMQMNDYIRLSFTGDEQNLIELREYLEEQIDV